MIEEYFKQLRKLLEENNYDDVDGVIAYFQEVVADKMEAGESEEEIYASFEEVHEVASSILGKTVTVQNDETNEKLHTIAIDVVCTDIVCAIEDVEDIEVKMPNDPRYEVKDENGILQISEKKVQKKFFFGNHNKITLILPKKYSLQNLKIHTISGDITILDKIEISNIHIETISGDVECENLKSKQCNISTTSGDIELEEVYTKKATLETVSGDIEMEECEIETCNASSVSGDITCEEIEAFDLQCTTVSGDIDVQLSMEQEVYTIEVHKLMKSMKFGSGPNHLRFATTSGDIEYRFE